MRVFTVLDRFKLAAYLRKQIVFKDVLAFYCYFDPKVPSCEQDLVSVVENDHSWKKKGRIMTLFLHQM